jgi:pyruvate kinase
VIEKTIFDEVVNVMQAAEEIGGPCPAEYVMLMRKIAQEANMRADACLAANVGGEHFQRQPVFETKLQLGKKTSLTTYRTLSQLVNEYQYNSVTTNWLRSAQIGDECPHWLPTIFIRRID